MSATTTGTDWIGIGTSVLTDTARGAAALSASISGARSSIIMVNAWWLLAELVALLALCIYTNRVNYRCGIWDGAFNQSLPIVRYEMLAYDPRRAKEILENEPGVSS